MVFFSAGFRRPRSPQKPAQSAVETRPDEKIKIKSKIKINTNSLSHCRRKPRRRSTPKLGAACQARAGPASIHSSIATFPGASLDGNQATGTAECSPSILPRLAIASRHKNGLHTTPAACIPIMYLNARGSRGCTLLLPSFPPGRPALRRTHIRGRFPHSPPFGYPAKPLASSPRAYMEFQSNFHPAGSPAMVHPCAYPVAPTYTLTCVIRPHLPSARAKPNKVKSLRYRG